MIVRDTDTVLSEHLRFLTESVTQAHNRGIVWFLTLAEMHFSGLKRQSAVPDQGPFFSPYLNAPQIHCKNFYSVFNAVVDLTKVYMLDILVDLIVISNQHKYSC